MDNLSVKTAKGMIWSIAENLGLQLIRFAFSILLARLLLPEQFGLIGMLVLFMAVAQSLLDSGFGDALIQKKDASYTDMCSVFYFNLLVSILLALVLCLGAPLIANFYGELTLIPLTRVLSLSIVANAFGLVPLTLLIKLMEFKALLRANLISALLSGLLGTGMAFLGFGVWSLAVQSVSAAFLRSMLIWIQSRWYPGRVFSLKSLKTLFAFGSRLLLSGLLDTLFRNVYQPIIGKLFSAADLGYYVRAQTMQAPIVDTVGAALARVMFSALSPLQDDRVKLKHVYRKTISTVTLFHFSLMAGMIVIAEPLITLLITERWAASIPYFQLLCFVGLFYPLQVLNLNILKVMGYSDYFFRLEVIKKALTAMSILITYRWGIAGLLYGQIAVSIMAYYLNSYYSGRLINYSTWDQIKDLLPVTFIGGLTASAMWIAGTLFSDTILLRLLAQCFIGTIVFLGMGRLLAGTVFIDVTRLAKQVLATVKTSSKQPAISPFE